MVRFKTSNGPGPTISKSTSELWVMASPGFPQIKLYQETNKKHVIEMTEDIEGNESWEI